MLPTGVWLPPQLVVVCKRCLEKRKWALVTQDCLEPVQWLSINLTKHLKKHGGGNASVAEDRVSLKVVQHSNMHMLNKPKTEPLISPIKPILYFY